MLISTYSNESDGYLLMVEHKGKHRKQRQQQQKKHERIKQEQLEFSDAQLCKLGSRQHRRHCVHFDGEILVLFDMIALCLAVLFLVTWMASTGIILHYAHLHESERYEEGVDTKFKKTMYIMVLKI